MLRRMDGDDRGPLGCTRDDRVGDAEESRSFDSGGEAPPPLRMTNVKLLCSG